MNVVRSFIKAVESNMIFRVGNLKVEHLKMIYILKCLPSLNIHYMKKLHHCLHCFRFYAKFLRRVSYVILKCTENSFESDEYSKM